MIAALWNHAVVTPPGPGGPKGRVARVPPGGDGESRGVASVARPIALTKLMMKDWLANADGSAVSGELHMVHSHVEITF